MRTRRWFGVFVSLCVQHLTVSQALPQSSTTLEGNQVGADFGRVLATGDFDRDGFGDLVVGAPRFDRPQKADAGRVTVYHGAAAGLATSPTRTLHGERGGDQLGTALAVGDVNGDGYDDLVVGAPGYDDLTSLHVARASLGHGSLPKNHGRTYVILGSPAGLEALAQRTLTGPQPEGHDGSVLACPGDVNGDGTDEILIGSPGWLGGQGGVFLFNGSPNGVVGGPTWTRFGEFPGAGQGLGLGPAGDVDSDGFADFLVVEPSVGQCGTATVFSGSALGTVDYPLWSHSAVSPGPVDDLDLMDGTEYFFVARTGYFCNDGLGLFVLEGPSSTPEFVALSTGLLSAVTGDVNGDGRSDLIYGDPSYTNGPFLGQVTVRLNGSPTYSPYGPSFPYHGAQAGADWGAALAAADVDGDGAAEVFVGAPREDAGQEDEGIVVLVPGWHEEVDLVLTDTLPSESPLVSADFDADGYSDLVSKTASGFLRVRRGSASGLLAAYSTLSLGVHGLELGPSLGDVNGDGFTDLQLTRASDSWVNHHVFLGSTSGLGPAPAVTLPVADVGEAELVGDVNGDGYDDLLEIRPGLGDQLRLGSAGGIVLEPFQTLPPAETQLSGEGSLGSGNHRAVLPGDLDGDAFGDVIIARFHPAPLGTHSLDAYQGSSAGLVPYDSWDAEALLPPYPAPYVGVVAWQDVDLDGNADLVIARFISGLAVFQVTAGGPVRSPQWWESSCFGLVEDLDADGLPDLYCGSLLHRGSPSGFSREPAWFGSTGTGPYQRADFDGDGLPSVTSKTFPASQAQVDIHEVVPF